RSSGNVRVSGPAPWGWAYSSVQRSPLVRGLLFRPKAKCRDDSESVTRWLWIPPRDAPRRRWCCGKRPWSYRGRRASDTALGQKTGSCHDNVRSSQCNRITLLQQDGHASIGRGPKDLACKEPL